MSGQTLLLAGLAGVGIFLVFWGMYTTRGSAVSGDMVQDRLAAFSGNKPLTLDEVELQKPFEERFIRPAIDRLGKYLAQNTPEKQRQDMQNKLNLAGRPGNLSPADFQALRYGLGIALFVIGLLVGLLFHSVVGLVLSALVGFVLGFFFPTYYIDSKVRARRKEIQLGLPDVMDLLTIAVEAGLGFDAAIQRVTEKFDNALADEFKTVLQEVRLGRPRLEALDEMGRRCGVEDLHNFTQAVIQSEQMGVGLAKILRLQSEEMRRKRRQRAEELAAQASLKMMLPMVGCIFPTLWLILLGPAVLIILKVKNGG
ncbi:MAG TPA: type II secretion system F family protein [Candidatus Dormibacteraeota bacterium]|jgi:tight adherence protein C